MVVSACASKHKSKCRRSFYLRASLSKQQFPCSCGYFESQELVTLKRWWKITLNYSSHFDSNVRFHSKTSGFPLLRGWHLDTAHTREAHTLCSTLVTNCSKRVFVRSWNVNPIWIVIFLGMYFQSCVPLCLIMLVFQSECVCEGDYKSIEVRDKDWETCWGNPHNKKVKGKKHLETNEKRVRGTVCEEEGRGSLSPSNCRGLQLFPLSSVEIVSPFGSTSTWIVLSVGLHQGFWVT